MMTSSKLTPAEKDLREFGITEPREIDLLAIAWTQGVRIRYRPLNSCEARIVGNGREAIVTVNSNSSKRRQRFSIAHELGHWKYHKGTLLTCQSSEIGSLNHSVHSPERVADQYAADLLMPGYIFDGFIRPISRVTFAAIEEIAQSFDVSLTAAAIRVVQRHAGASMLVCHTQRGRKWFVRPKHIPDRWFPRIELDSESFAFGVQFGRMQNDRFPRKVGADAWFDRREANKYDIQEQTVRVSSSETLTLLTFGSPKMLEEQEY